MVESACSVGDPGLIPGSGRSPGRENGNLLKYSCLENPMNRGAWQATVHGVANSQIPLSHCTFFLPTTPTAISLGQTITIPLWVPVRVSSYISLSPAFLRFLLSLSKWKILWSWWNKPGPVTHVQSPERPLNLHPLPSLFRALLPTTYPVSLTLALCRSSNKPGTAHAQLLSLICWHTIFFKFDHMPCPQRAWL